MLQQTSSSPSGEFSESDGIVIKRKGSVHVLHESVSQEPNVVAETQVLSRQCADALIRAKFRLAQRDILGRNRKVCATPVKGDLWRRVAREGEEAILLVEELAASGLVDGLHSSGGAIHHPEAGPSQV